MFNLKTKLIAHRGYSSKATENTMEAFRLAGTSNFYGIEFDVHVTKDNEFIVFHDNTTARLSNVDLIIKDLTLEEVKGINLYDKTNNQISINSKIPNLIEVLELCLKYDKYCIVELKNIYSKENIIKFLNVLETYNYEKVIIISFTLNNLIEIRNINKDIKMQYLTSKYHDDLIDTCLKYQLDIDIHYKALSVEVIKSFHQNNIKVNTWTVNNLETITQLVADNVDFITTDGI